MKRNELVSYAYDFIHILLDNCVYKIDDIILFGSVARGDFDKDSDIDIFINTKNEKSVQVVVDKSLREFEKLCEHTWDLRKISLPIKCIVGNLNSNAWKILRREIISSGIVLYGSYKELPKELEHKAILTFNFAKLKPSKKVRIIRKIYGYEIRKGKKLYNMHGLLKELDGEKINPSTILLPMKNYKIMHDFLAKNKVNFKIREAWM